MVSQWGYPERRPWFMEEWLGQWWPVQRASNCLAVSNTQTGATLLRVEAPNAATPGAISHDGQTLVTSWWEEERIVIACWDIPGRPSMWWVLGVPLIMGVVSLLVTAWRRKKTAPTAAAPVS
jgi:hypothetical protein